MRGNFHQPTIRLSGKYSLTPRFFTKKGKNMLTFAFLFVVFFPLCVLHGGEYAGEYGKVIGAIVAFTFSLIISMIIKLLEKTSSEKFGGFHLGEKEPQWRFRERQSSKIKQARRLKTEGGFSQATKILDKVLKEDPNCSEAMFVKAQILFYEFKELYSAGRYLKQVIKQTSKDTRLNEQAIDLFKELNPVEQDNDSYNPFESIEED